VKIVSVMVVEFRVEFGPIKGRVLCVMVHSLRSRSFRLLTVSLSLFPSMLRTIQGKA